MLRPPLTAVEVVRAVRSGELSALECIDTALANAEKHADLNPFIVVSTDTARATASAVDHAVASGAPIPPLAGLPIAVKDNIDLAGLPTTGATRALRHGLSHRTAPVLRRLLAAGAIPIGKTNMHELALGFTNVNHSAFAGVARNPFDPARIAGGSSGGSAVAIAAGIVPAGLGTDTGGSVRIPAALCGIAGLRPSVGGDGAHRRYDGAGVLPISRTRDTIGPMARTVADLALLDEVVTSAPPLTPSSIAGVRLGIPQYFWVGLDKRIGAVARHVVAKLEEAGAVLVEADLPDLHELHELTSMPILTHEFSRDFAPHVASTRSGAISIDRIVADASNPDVRSFLERFVLDGDDRVDDHAYLQAIHVHRPELQRRYRNYFADNDVSAMLFPTSAHPAALIDAPEIRDGGLAHYMRNTSPASCAGIPGLSLFGGMTADGLPVGIELDGPVGGDRVLLSLGVAIEALLGSAPVPSGHERCSPATEAMNAPPGATAGVRSPSPR